MENIKLEKPRLRTPISLILDDSSPGEPFYSEFVDAFADLATATGIKGKFSLMPYTFPETLAQALDGTRPALIKSLLEKIRTNIVPHFDITPEILTHNALVDLNSGGFVYPCLAEPIWSQTQNTQTLTPYIARSLQILKQAGFEASGITSPSNFGEQVEDEYARAILDAQMQVNGLSLTWYFLHVDTESPSIQPRLALADKARGQAVVSIPSGYGDYVTEPKLENSSRTKKIRSYADQYLTIDGRHGRLVDLFHSDSPLIFHHHWWRMMKDDRLGFDILRELAGRLFQIFGDNAQWMKISEIARYFATQNSFEVNIESTKNNQFLSFKSPFTCPDFTISFTAGEHADDFVITGGKQTLQKLRKGEPLRENSWFFRDKRLYLCFDLAYESVIKISGAAKLQLG